jgi:hypothetical protein
LAKIHRPPGFHRSPVIRPRDWACALLLPHPTHRGQTSVYKDAALGSRFQEARAPLDKSARLHRGLALAGDDAGRRSPNGRVRFSVFSSYGWVARERAGRSASPAHAEVEETLQSLAAQWERLGRGLDATGQQATGQHAQQPQTKERDNSHTGAGSPERSNLLGRARCA